MKMGKIQRFRYVAVMAMALCLSGMVGLAQEMPAQAAVKVKTTPATGPVHINQATAQQLESLPGVGPALAKRILDFRQKNGPFKKVEDLLSVPGIGEKSLERLRGQIIL